MSLGSNGMDRECSLRKILKRHRCTNFCSNCTSLARLDQVSCSSETVSKCTRTERNAPKHEFRVQWCGSGAFVVKKFLQDIVAWTFALIAPVWRILHQVSCSSETVPNAPKWKETHQNMSLRSNGVDREHLLWKNSYKTSWHELLH